MITTYKYGSYDEYLNVQKTHQKTKSRTRARKNNRIKDLAMIRSISSNAKSILCVGCRDLSEINFFKDNGFTKVKGIDLFSDNEELVKIGDMHKLDEFFENDSFDFVYMSHSLEHSVDPIKVLNMVASIATVGVQIALPLRGEPSRKDPSVFPFMSNPSLEKIQEYFMENLPKLKAEGFSRREDKHRDIGKDFAFCCSVVKE